MVMRIAKRPRGDRNGCSLGVFGDVLAIGNAQGEVSHEFLGWLTMRFKEAEKLDVVVRPRPAAPAGFSSTVGC